MKKILFFTSSHKIGCTAHSTEIALNFSKTNFFDYLFLSGEKEQFSGLFAKLDAKKINYAKIKGLDEHSNFLMLVSEFTKYINNFNPNILTVHTNWQLVVSIAAKYLKKKKYKIVYIVRGYRHNHKIKSIIAKCVIGSALYLFADKIITPSSFVKKEFSFLGKKNKIIFLGESDQLFKEYPLPVFNGTKKIIFPGEFRKGKNQDLLIRTVNRYIKKSEDTNIKLYLPGKGEAFEKCKNLAKELKIEKNVIFPGFLDRNQMLNLYLKCQFAIAPANSETFGHCIVEPFILGRVVISRHIGVADDIIIHGKTGFFFDNEHDLLDVLLIIFHDKNLCASVSMNAYNQRHIFRMEAMCNELNKLYTSL